MAACSPGDQGNTLLLERSLGKDFLIAWLGEPGLPLCTGSYGAAGPVPCPLLAPADSFSLLQADLGTHEMPYLFECITVNCSGRTR